MPENIRQERTRRRTGLAQRRKTAGLTQEQLADRLAVDPTTVARWERGETQPQPWLRPKLARLLKVTPDQIVELLAVPVPRQPSGPEADGPGPSMTVPAADRGQGRSRGGTEPVVPRQLPAEVVSFTGRTAELAALTRLLDETAGTPDRPGAVVILAIGGTAGVGKTALALHWAHRVADRFGDGQLHVNLRGFDPGGSPLSPERAIRGFLDTLGVPPERIPAQPEAQAGLYRTLLADRKTLIVLDNARDEQQVRPLLPTSPGSLVLVTSRSQLTGLAAADGARLLTLDVLGHGEAVQLLTIRIGTNRAAKEPEAIEEIARLCVHLPLALAVSAARAATRPSFPLSTLAAELRDAHGRLDALDAGEPTASVRAVLSWSYWQLSPGAARMFRLLGLHPGPDISVAAAASLSAVAVPDARRLLRELARACLIDEHAPGRYAFHDLLRVYASDGARDIDSEADRREATERILDHYLHTAVAAAQLLHHGQDPVAFPLPSPGTAPESFADHWKALAWFEAEQRVLLSAVALADSGGFDRHAWQLPWALTRFLNNRGYYREWEATQRTALAAATRLGDAAAQAVCRRKLGVACAALGDFPEAREHYERGRELYGQLGDHLGEAKVHHDLGMLAERQGRYPDALRHAERALALYQSVSDSGGEVDLLNDLGWCHSLRGDYRQARDYSRRALAHSRGTGDRRAEGLAWDSLGYAEHHLGNLDEATVCYERSVGIAREFGDRWGEAEILTHLGETCQAAADSSRAGKAWRQALEILEDLEHPNVTAVRAKLDALDE